VTKLAVTSKEADNILKKVKIFESKCMNNEVTIEEFDKNLRQTTKMASDNEQKLDELSRKLGVQEDELKRALERAELAEKNLASIEEELQQVGENMKQLELSAEKAVEREERLKDKILQIKQKYKAAEGRYGDISRFGKLRTVSGFKWGRRGGRSDKLRIRRGRAVYVVAENHRLNIEVDLQCLFWLNVTCDVHSRTHWLETQQFPPPPSPRIWSRIGGRYWSAKLDDIS
jgi:predicted RNase H-like nuclease (RuvC/YqgF family)